uniref:mRNA capping enzyme with OTU-like cysteine protease n=1 Tax=Pithovirus LCPAC404 TaxID=2506597 RepID=A0A481ZCB2_9VIRU|nr:MAG: mRNA capping enzyme with OTU-like cysteine protease [Pithovirus LCPAC404]
MQVLTNLINQDIATGLSSISGRSNVNVEVEARFVYPDFARVGVPQEVWNATLSALMRVPEGPGFKRSKYTEMTKDILVNRVPDTLRETSGQRANDRLVKKMVKKRINEHKSTQYPFKVVISTERNGFTKDEIRYWNNQEPSTVRLKTRTSFYIGRALRVDMTVISQTSQERRRPQQKTIQSYEIELELLNNDSVDILMNGITYLLKILLDTSILYTLSERQSLVDYMAETVSKTGKPNRGSVNHGIFNQARNVKYDDLRDGGILGYSEMLKTNIGYTVTLKADGIRKMLVIHNSAIWLISPPFFINKLTGSIEEFSRLNGTVLDGELLTAEHMNPKFKSDVKDKRNVRSKLLYLIIDLIYPRIGNWKNRHDYAKEISRFFRNDIVEEIGPKRPDTLKLFLDLLEIRTKDFESFYSAEEFFDLTTNLLERSRTLAYKTDGLIFTPIATSYNPSDFLDSEIPELYLRNITIWPEILKYKPPEDLTIDFKVSRNQKGELILESLERVKLRGYTRVQLREFTGTRRYPLTINMIDQSISTYEGQIIEMEWNERKKQLIFRNTRPYKPSPNGMDVAKDIWNSIHDPITDKTITGDNLQFLFKYHNRIKSKLISSLNVSDIILDIGSGHGGDVLKWKNASHIYAVEPNSENRAKLRKRLQSANMAKMAKKVTIIPCRGQDRKTIAEYIGKGGHRKVDAILFMFSLSFFDDLNDVKQLLIDFLKPDGVFIYTTIDGNAVSEMFKPVLDYDGEYVDTDYWDFEGLFKIAKIPDSNRIHLSIPESKTAKEQDEFLVDIPVLSKILYENGYTSSLRERSDKETFMPVESFKITNLYSYGIFFRKPRTYVVSRNRVEPQRSLAHPLREVEFSEIEEKQPVESKAKLSIPSFASSSISFGRVRKPLSVVSNLNAQVALGDDRSEELESKSFSDVTVVRIAVIDDGMSLLHSILKSINFLYQKYNTYIYRRDFARKYLKDFADAGIVISTGNGNDIRPTKELFSELSEKLRVNIYVIKPFIHDVVVIVKPDDDNTKLAIVLSWNNWSYELIAIERKSSYVTVFSNNDEFITLLNRFY